MKKIFTLVCSIASVILTHAQLPALEWAKSMGSNLNDAPTAVVTDADDNVYTVGSFRGTIDFDPSEQVLELNSAGVFDVFITKSDAAGNLIWAKNMGGEFSELAGAVAVDAAGNVYTTGSFEFKADFDPGAGVFTLTPSGGSDIFISKLDKDGSFVYAKRLGSNVVNEGEPLLALDASGNVYLSSFFSGTTDMNPAAAINNVVSAGSSDVFVLKLSAAGDFIWAKSFGGISSESVTAITSDAAGNVYACGLFSETADFNPGEAVVSATANGFDDMYVISLSQDGNFNWVKTFGGADIESINNITVDAIGNVYAAGEFSEEISFGANTVSFTAEGGNDIYFLKLNAAGAFVWAKKIGGASDDEPSGIKADAAGNIYATGYFNGTVDFDPGAASLTLVSAGSDDIFISKINTDGNLVWAFRMGGSSTDDGLDITLDKTGNIYTTGFFGGTVDFDPATATAFNLTSNGDVDIFVHKLNGGNPLPLNLTAFTGQLKTGFSQLQWQTANEVNIRHFLVERSTDGSSFLAVGKVSAYSGAGQFKYSFIDNIVSGHAYYYRLKMVDKNGLFAYSQVIHLYHLSAGDIKPAIYPNPATDIISITGTQNNGIIRLWDANGKLLQQVKTTAAVTNVNIGMYAKGIYLVQYNMGNDILNEKIIKQ